MVSATEDWMSEGFTELLSLVSALPSDFARVEERFAQIRTDLAQPVPMQRLVQGDVGSGKTVVAALAATLAVERGCQVALAAPTELLAEQHLANLRTWLEPLGKGTWQPPRVELND